MNKSIGNILLSWFEERDRSLPWREDPTPYHVYLSEIMLQQTRVEAVKEYYHRFLLKYPTLKSFVDSTEDEYNKLWQGLGYYSRVRNLHQSCSIILNQYQGIIPDDYKTLISLPGIGDYTACAILSIAYHKPYVALDGNLMRIFSRLTLFDGNIKEEKSKDMARSFFLPLVSIHPSKMNQALMDIGQLYCLPHGKPHCFSCPFSSTCKAHQEERELDYPVKTEKKNKKSCDKTIFLFRYKNEVCIQKRPNNGLLASLYEFPNVDSSLSDDDVKRYLNDLHYSYSSYQFIGKGKHIFTHLIWNMKAYEVILKEKPTGLFVSLEELKNTYSIPTAFAFITKILETE